MRNLLSPFLATAAVANITTAAVANTVAATVTTAVATVTTVTATVANITVTAVATITATVTAAVNTVAIAGATIAVIAAAPVAAADADRPTLTVYTYDSFESKWGPGPKIKEAFEARCDCVLRYVAADSSTGILSRVQLEGDATRADVVLGLDSHLTVEAMATGLLAKHNVDLARLTAPFAWDDEVFLPFDYGYFAFIYDSEKLPAPPASLRELVAAGDELKILIQDPRSSTPGLGLLLWVKALYGENSFDAWRALADNIVTVTRGWSEAYGLFLDGEADMVLSYTTSPAYHITVDGEDKYRAAAFAEGHGMQIEVAAQLAGARAPALAQMFMDFIVSTEFQAVIPRAQWMYPVVDLPGGLPAAYNDLAQPAARLRLDAREVAANKTAWVEEFSRALRR